MSSLSRRSDADSAIALLRLGHGESLWPLLRHSSDPSIRSYLIHALGPRQVDAQLLIARLDVERDVSIRRALILALGEYTSDQVPLSLRAPLVPKLLDEYRDDPDPGIHSAIDWLLRPDREGDRPRRLDWDQSSAIQRIDDELARSKALENRRRWYVNGEGFTMVVFHGPVEFKMGSPVSEIGRVPSSDSPDEPLHEVRIPRSFAIASKEVTVAQFRRFLDENPDVKVKHVYPGHPDRMAEVQREFSPDDDGPQIAVTWYEAAMYCNWLSRKEGIPESEWVYPSDSKNISAGMILPQNYLQRTGYRLPTEAEWEFAARAGAATAHFFGTSDSLLDKYAWYSKHPPKQKTDLIDPGDPHRTWPVGELKPNDFGLFDVYGNVWEWTQGRVLDSTTLIKREDVEDQVRVVSDSAARARRGGGFSYEAAMMRSAERGTVTAYPFLRRDNVGFRIARTLAPSSGF